MLNRRTARGLILATAVASVSSILSSSQAQNWATSVNGNWTDGTKWVGGVAPVSGATTALTFGASGAAAYTATNDNAGTFTLNSITGTSTSTGLITLAGNQLSFGGTNPAINQNGSGAIQISNAIDLAARLTFGGTGSGTVALTGPITSTPVASFTTGNGITLSNAAGRLDWSGGGTIKYLIANQGTVYYTGGSGTLTSSTNSLPNAAALPDTSLVAGDVAGQTGTINISGGTLFFGNGYAGHTAGATGYITITGPTTVVNTDLSSSTNGGRLGVNAGAGTILINNGAKLNTILLEGGRTQGSTTDITIDGANTNAAIGQFVMGRGGTVASTGNLTISNNASVDCTVVGGSTSNVFIASGSLTTGSLNVVSGGRFTIAGALVTAPTPTSVANIRVSGANSLLQVETSQFTGNGPGVAGGTTNLSVDNGGVATFTSSLLLARGVNSRTLVTIDGPGSQLAASGIGQISGGSEAGAIGTINVTNSGQLVANGSSFYSTGTGATMIFNVSSNGVCETGNQFTPGGGATTGGGTAIFNINPTGILRSNALTFAATRAGCTAIINLNGGRWEAANDVLLSAGDPTLASGVSTLNITNGGVASFTTGGIIGRELNTQSTVLVSGANSQLYVGDGGELGLSFGASAAATLSVSSGAQWYTGGNVFTSTDPSSVSSILMNASTGSITGNVILSGGNGTIVHGNSNLTVSNGALLAVSGLVAAQNTGGQATVVVDNALLNLTTSFGGFGDLSVGGVLSTTTVSTGAMGTMTVQNNGSVTVGGDLYVAPLSAGATGLLNILGTGTMDVAGDLIVGDGATTAGTINVNGGSAEFGVNGSMYLSSGLGAGSVTGQATLNVGSGGFAASTNIFMATNVGMATANVDGDNSLLAAVSNDGTSNFIVSDDLASAATLNVTNGGAALILDGIGSLSGAMFVSPSVGAAGSVNMSGATSFIGAGQIQLGGQGGTLGGFATYTQTGGTSVSALTRVYGSSTLNYNGGTFATGVLTVDGQVIMSAGNNRTLEVGTLTINTGGRIDLGDNGMIIDYPTGSLSPASTVRGYIKSGRGIGIWDGAEGITSSTAAGNPAKFGVGYAQVGTGTNEVNITTFRGIAVDADTVVVRETYNGDANLDGSVNSLDFNRLAAGYGMTSGAEWANGDFNYDDKVNTADFNYVAGNFNATPLGSPVAGPTLGSKAELYKLSRGEVSLAGKMEALLMLDEKSALQASPNMSAAENMDASLLGAAAMSDGVTAPNLGSAVPEPGTLGLLTLAGAGLSIRRRREAK